MIRKALVLGAVSISLACIATACVSNNTNGGSGGSGGGLAGAAGSGGTAGTGTGGTAGTGTGGTGGGTGGTGATGATGGSGGGDAGKQYTLPTGCLADPTQWTVECNPVSNDGCDTSAGQACDFSQGGWSCYDPPNDKKLGEVCDPNNSEFCQGTLTCDMPPTDGGTAGGDAGTGDAGATGICKHYCCSDSDCSGGTCTAFNAQVGTIGVCN